MAHNGLGDWRLLFLANIALGLIAAVVVLVTRPGATSPEKRERVDVVGMATLSVAILSLLYAPDDGEGWGWSSARVLGSIGVALTTVIVWAVSTAHFSGGLAAMDVTMPAADQQALNASALEADAIDKILAPYSAEDRRLIRALTRDSFTLGLRRAYALPLLSAVVGLVVCLFIDSRKITRPSGVGREPEQT